MRVTYNGVAEIVVRAESPSSEEEEKPENMDIDEY